MSDITDQDDLLDELGDKDYNGTEYVRMLWYPKYGYVPGHTIDTRSNLVGVFAYTLTAVEDGGDNENFYADWDGVIQGLIDAL